MVQQPTGTIIFIFSDIEGNSKKWEQQPDAMRAPLQSHHPILRGAIEANQGFVLESNQGGG
jgi:hypothetical protein